MAKKTKESKITYPRLLVGASAVGLIAAFWQMVERVHMLKNPGDPLSCNLNPVVDCGSVLGDSLASVFGPPNALIGVVMFTMLLTLGLQRLYGGQWTKLTKILGVALSTIALLFSLWFFHVSLYVIGKVCIFCIFIWAASVPIGIYGAKDFLDGMTKPKGVYKWKRDLLDKYHLLVLFGLYAVMLGLFLVRFSDYYFG